MNKKIILLAIEGLSREFIEPLIRDGRVKTLKRIQKEGVSGDIKTDIPTVSPSLWTTVITSKKPENHGIRGHVLQYQNKVVPYTSNMRRSKALWNIFTDFGKTVAVVGWLASWPAERVNGYFVSSYKDLKRKDPKGTLYKGIPNQTYPENLITELEPIIEDSHDQGEKIFEKVFPGDFSLNELHEMTAIALKDTKWMLTSDYLFSRIAFYLKKKYDPDFLTLYLCAGDPITHRFWKYKRPRRFSKYIYDSNEVEMFQGTIENYLTYVDELIGEFYDTFMDDSTIFLVMSDHGSHPRREIDIDVKSGVDISGDHYLAPDGMFFITGGGVKEGLDIKTPKYNCMVYNLKTVLDSLGRGFHKIGRIFGFAPQICLYDIAPTLLSLLNLPVARDMEGRVLEEIIKDEFLQQNPVRYINTYGMNPNYKTGIPILSPIDEEITDNLRKMGYIKG